MDFAFKLNYERKIVVWKFCYVNIHGEVFRSELNAICLFLQNHSEKIGALKIY